MFFAHVSGDHVARKCPPDAPPALGAMLSGAALGTLIMAVTWDCVHRARLVSVSVPGIRQQSGLDAAKPTAVLKVSQQGMHVAARR